MFWAGGTPATLKTTLYPWLMSGLASFRWENWAASTSIKLYRKNFGGYISANHRLIRDLNSIAYLQNLLYRFRHAPSARSFREPSFLAVQFTKTNTEARPMRSWTVRAGDILRSRARTRRR